MIFIIQILQESNDIDQTISTIGLKKVPVEKYVMYQKGVTIDFCVMQQNAFHDLDACTRPDRLEVINKAVQTLIDTPLDFSQEKLDDEELKEQIKTQFDELRQWWRDWNSNAREEAQINSIQEKINQFVLQEEYAL